MIPIGLQTTPKPYYVSRPRAKDRFNSGFSEEIRYC